MAPRAGKRTKAAPEATGDADSLLVLEDFMPFQLAVVANRVSAAIARIIEKHFGLPASIFQRCHLFGRSRLVALGIEQGVLLDFLSDKGFDFEIGERQQTDRLLKLWRHHQRLALPQVKTRPKCHD